MCRSRPDARIRGWLPSPARAPRIHQRNRRWFTHRPTRNEGGRLLAVGRKLFVARCSRCHGERGEKSLSTGLPLSQRKLMPEQLARSVEGRLQDSTEEQRRAVQLYIESFLDQESRERTSN